MKPVAVLDIGTNSFHLLIGYYTSLNKTKILHQEKLILRLTENSLKNFNTISSSAIEKAVSVILKYKRIAEKYDAYFIVTATSAVRSAKNKNEFLKKIFYDTGIKIKVLSGLEEAKYIFQGVVKNFFENFNKTTLIIDIGGGSTELVFGKSGGIIFAESLDIGAVKLSHRFFPNFILTDKRVTDAQKYVENKIFTITENSKIPEAELIIGTSGTILNVGMILKSIQNKSVVERKEMNDFELTAEKIFEIEKKILSLKKPSERNKIVGLEKGRGDIIAAGIIILSSVFRILKLKQMKISLYGLREGIIASRTDD
jgi:exopolyphosphatase/guanosine-5'-triphosphate,3'-diphosphate pyrophosphatase